MCEVVQNAGQYCNNIGVQLLVLLIGSGRLPETPGHQVLAQNFTCQHNAASRWKNQSAVRQSLTKQK